MNHAGESVSAVQVRTECSTSAAPSCFFYVETGKVNATNYSVEEAQIPWKVARRYRLIWKASKSVEMVEDLSVENGGLTPLKRQMWPTLHQSQRPSLSNWYGSKIFGFRFPKFQSLVQVDSCVWRWIVLSFSLLLHMRNADERSRMIHWKRRW